MEGLEKDKDKKVHFDRVSTSTMIQRQRGLYQDTDLQK